MAGRNGLPRLVRQAGISAPKTTVGLGVAIVGALGVLISASVAPTCASADAVSEAGVAGAPSRETFFIDAGALPEWVYAERLVARSAPEIAVYDISAHVVVMPDGARLEAHSGLDERADVPRFVRERMRGPTPPALYELTPRERPFHGVAALRLKAISGEVFGRSGLLAHTYMLGGRPVSNGCVVFRDYAAFLQAFREGRVKRLRVVPVVGDAALRIARSDEDVPARRLEAAVSERSDRLVSQPEFR